MDMSNKIMKEVFDKVGGNVKNFHNLMCSVTKTDPKTVNMTSLYWKAKQNIQEMQRLKKFPDKTKFQDFCKVEFHFPKTKRKLDVPEVVDKKRHKSDNSYINQIHHLTNEIFRLKVKLRNLNIFRMNAKLKQNRKTIDRLNLTIKRLKASKTRTPVDTKLEDKGVQCNSMRNIIKDLKSEIEDLKFNCEADDKENVSGDVPNFLNFRENSKGKPYNAKIRELYYIFRSRNIALEHIEPIIRAVLSIVGVEVDELPSISTASKLTSELGVVSRKQVEEQLIMCDNITMHRDATTKKGRHFYGVELSTGQNILTAGLREVHDGTGETYLDCTNEILNDITTRTIENNQQTLCKVTNFMTDRSATEQKVNNLLTDQRDKVLRESGKEKPAHSFKCSVHPLLQFSDVCQKEINTIEKDCNVYVEGCNRNESVSHLLLRCVSKLFYKDGSGDPLLAATYMINLGIKDIPIMNFRGNRFNTLFYNSAGTYYLHQHLIEYLKSSKSSLNFTQNFIVKALENSTVLSIIRALGIISKIITEPYWQKAGDEFSTALGMGSVYIRLVDFLKECGMTPWMMLNNDMKLFYGPSKEIDHVSASLFTSSKNDNDTAAFLKRFCYAIKSKCDHLFKQFLPGGKYFEPLPSVIEGCESCPSNNITVERLMAKLDSKLKSAPTSTTNNVESVIMFRNNETEVWLNSKTDSEKSHIITQALKENKTVLEQAKNRKKILFDKHVKVIKERKECVKRREQRKQKNVNTAKEDLVNLGLWNDQQRINSELSKFQSKKDKICMLKKQINLYKTLFPVTANDKHLLLFSCKGKQHDVNTLTNNLLQLIQSRTTTVIPKSICEKPTKLVGKRFRHIWTDSDQNVEWNAKFCSYKKGMFQVQYWLENEDDEDDSAFFDLTKEEIDTDYREGNLFLLGNTKKFLYTGPKQKDEQTDNQWIFSPRKPDLSPRGGGQFDLEDVWSIKKNVSLGVGKPEPKTDGLNLNANKSYYSRYGGGPKGNRDEFDSSFGSSNFRTRNSDAGNKSWNSANKGFSYSAYNNVNNVANGKMSNSTSPLSNKSLSQPYTNHRNGHDNSLW